MQGEGEHVGALTTFVRLAGCSVGKRNPNSANPQYETCRRFDGEFFTCDTDFRMKQRMTVTQIMLALDHKASVCITGGEPFDHDLAPLIKRLYADSSATFFTKPRYVSIETSGTKTIPSIRVRPTSLDIMSKVHITVSPKFGWLPRTLWGADEVKVLVDKDFSQEKFEEILKNINGGCKVFLQPVNYINSIDKDNLERCMQILRNQTPSLCRQIRISIQLHKLLEMR